MIFLLKGPMPEVLQRNAAKWTADLLAAIAAGKKADELRKANYNKPAIKDALKLETRNKCAYCESNLLHVTYGDIEHITPKDSDPDKAYEWINLTLACDVCNTKKSNKRGMLDPYTDNPSDHLEFKGPMVMTLSSPLGRVTSVGMGLNRPELIERRTERLLDLERRGLEVGGQVDAVKRAIFLQALEEYACDPATEYQACLSQLIEDMKDSGSWPES